MKTTNILIKAIICIIDSWETLKNLTKRHRKMIRMDAPFFITFGAVIAAAGSAFQFLRTHGININTKYPASLLEGLMPIAPSLALIFIFFILCAVRNIVKQHIVVLENSTRHADSILSAVSSICRHTLYRIHQMTSVLICVSLGVPIGLIAGLLWTTAEPGDCTILAFFPFISLIFFLFSTTATAFEAAQPKKRVVLTSLITTGAALSFFYIMVGSMTV